MEKSYWWCHPCGVKVAPATVTFETCHDRCGHEVEHISPEEVGLVEQLRAEVNRLQDQLVQLVSFETTEKRNEALHDRITQLEADCANKNMALYEFLQIIRDTSGVIAENEQVSWAEAFPEYGDLRAFQHHIKEAIKTGSGQPLLDVLEALEECPGYYFSQKLRDALAAAKGKRP
jgi:hypothetical protein